MFCFFGICAEGAGAGGVIERIFLEFYRSWYFYAAKLPVGSPGDDPCLCSCTRVVYSIVVGVIVASRLFFY